MEALRQRVHLDMMPWNELPDELLALAFRQPSLVPRKAERLHLEDFEQYGDAVLELVITEVLFHRVSGPGVMSRLREELVRNTTLYSFMAKEGLCQYIQGHGQLTGKDCADVFEALVGVLYFWIAGRGEGDALVHVGKYLRQWWYTDAVLQKVLAGQSIDVDPHTGCSLRPAGKDALITGSPSPRARRRARSRSRRH
jgi:hypothetical protein